MGSQIWVISDTHFGHEKMVTMTEESGVAVRPGFATASEWDELIVENWNAVVQPNHRVYHLGDVAMQARHLKTCLKLNGKKRLLTGNHDIYHTQDYLDVGFEKIYGVRVIGTALLSHFPVHLSCMDRYSVNIHGHLHNHVIPFNQGGRFYQNVCVERTHYKPIPIEELIT